MDLKLVSFKMKRNSPHKVNKSENFFEICTHTLIEGLKKILKFEKSKVVSARQGQCTDQIGRYSI